jgi:hypothetical protein
VATDAPDAAADAGIDADGSSTVAPDGGLGAAGTSSMDGGVGGTGGDPGLAVVRRLNRGQYDRTVRDLLDTSLTPAQAFPADDLLYGFDTIGAALSISPLHAEAYDRAAQQLIDELFAQPQSDAYGRYIVCDVESEGDACASDILLGFAERAWRRPVHPSELAAYVELLAQGASPEEGLRTALQAVLTSVHFLFRLEIDPDPADSEPHALTDHELATRLSYLLWGSMPDEALFAAAASGDLSSDAGLSAELERMLVDERSRFSRRTWPACGWRRASSRPCSEIRRCIRNGMPSWLRRCAAKRSTSCGISSAASCPSARC